MRFGACQTPEVLGDLDRAVEVIRTFAADSDEACVDLLVFPECFLQGYFPTQDHVQTHALAIGSPELDAVLARLGDVRPLLAIGLIERDDDRFYNTAILVSGGEVVGRYRKTHLVPGESVFTAGTEYPVFECHGVRFGINICYDLQFAEAAAAVAAAGAQVVLGLTQNMMRLENALLWQHRHNAITAERARETGLWIVRSDVTGERGSTHIGVGPTSVIGPTGEVVAQVPAGTVGMVTQDVATAP